MAQRFVRLRVEPGAESAKLVETARPGIEPEPAAEPLARLDALAKGLAALFIRLRLGVGVESGDVIHIMLRNWVSD